MHFSDSEFSNVIYFFLTIKYFFVCLSKLNRPHYFWTFFKKVTKSVCFHESFLKWNLVYIKVQNDMSSSGIKIHVSTEKLYTRGTQFLIWSLQKTRFLHVKFPSCRTEGTIMISSKIRDCFWAALFFLPRVYHSWIFVSMNLIKDASKDLGLPHCTLKFKENMLFNKV